jgi:hypothetical protein
MSFLAKLGGFLAKGIALLAGLGPLITPWLGSSASKAANVEGQIVNDLTSVGQVVLSVESLMQTPGSGTVKLAAATPLVVQILKTSELISGHQIGDDNLFAQGAAKITSGVADVLNSLKADNVKSTGTPVAPISAPPVVTPLSVITPAPVSLPASAPATGGEIPGNPVK